MSLLNSLVKEVAEHYEHYEPTRAGRAIQDFVNDNLSNWYVRLNRKRFWGGKYDSDKIAAYQTLYTCLLTVAKLMAPIAPFYAERLWLDLNGSPKKGESVHLQDFPKANEGLIDRNLEACMQYAQQISSMILALRRKADKKVRQPLLKAVVPTNDTETFEQIKYVAELIKTEVNIKNLEVLSPDTEMDNIVKKIKPNFKTLGKRYGKLMKEIAAAFAAFGNREINEIEKSGRYTFSLPSGEKVDLLEADVEITTEDMPGWLMASEGKLTVALDITVTPELEREGIARELVNRIQNIRKANNYEITDKISIRIERNENIASAVGEFASYISTQVLASSLEVVDRLDKAEELDFDDYVVRVSIEKI